MLFGWPVTNFISLNGHVVSEYWTGKDVHGSSCGLIKVLSWHLIEVTEENYTKS
jgi:hypothetical protein